MLIALKIPAFVHLAISVLILDDFRVVGNVGVVQFPWAMLLMDRLTFLHYFLDNARLSVTIFTHHAYLRVVALWSYLLYLPKQYIPL